MEILNFEKAIEGKYELATFDLDFGAKWGMTIFKFKLYKSKNGHYYFKSPAYKAGELNGKPNWKPYVDFYGEKGKDFNNSVLELLKPFIDNSLTTREDEAYFF